MTEDTARAHAHRVMDSLGVGTPENHAEVDATFDRTEKRAEDRQIPNFSALDGPTSRTSEHPLVKRLRRQAMQLNYAADSATNNTAANMLRQQAAFVSAMATLGERPDLWDDMAEQMIPVNVDMLATVVAAGYAKLPPATVDHD